MSRTEPSVLWVEDIETTIRGASLRLEHRTYRGAVRFAKSVEEARQLLRAKSFKCMILDLKLPMSDAAKDVVYPEGGKQLVKALKEGKFGNRNADIRFVVHTGMTHYVDDEIAGLQGYIDAFQKVDDVEPMLKQVIAAVDVDEGEAVRWSTPARFVGSDETCAILVIDSWDSSESLKIAFEDLPPAVLVKIAGRKFPLHVVLTANIGADRASDLQISDIRIATVPSDEEVGL